MSLPGKENNKTADSIQVGIYEYNSFGGDKQKGRAFFARPCVE
jgi:hypothetical protein